MDDPVRHERFVAVGKMGEQGRQPEKILDVFFCVLVFAGNRTPRYRFPIYVVILESI